jgi:hypothetical protein
MTATTEASVDVGSAVQALQPKLRFWSALALTAMTALGIGSFIGAFGAYQAIDDGTDAFKAAALIAAAGGIAIYFTYVWLRRSQEALVMPVVASAVGLIYEKDASGFRKSLPKRLLPQAV